MVNLDKEINYVKDQIIAIFRPEKIILFGSAVHGKFKEDSSDLDFCIIKEDVPNRFIDRRKEVRKKIDYNIACDFLVYKSSEIKERLKMGDPLVKEIYNKGSVIYG